MKMPLRQSVAAWHCASVINSDRGVLSAVLRWDQNSFLEILLLAFCWYLLGSLKCGEKDNSFPHQVLEN